MRARRSIPATCALVLVLAGAAGAAIGFGDQEPLDLEAARARWESLDPERRAQLAGRFEELRAMDGERRRALDERLAQLRSAESEALEELPRPAREELEGLRPAERREVVRELAHDALVERSRRVREALPPATRSRLDGADAERVRDFVRERKRARHGERLGMALGELGRELGVPAEERARLSALAPEEREAELIELHRRLLDRRVEQNGLPAWIEPGEWETWRDLRGREFFERVERRRRERGARLEGAAEDSGPARPGPARGPRSDRGSDSEFGRESGHDGGGRQGGPALGEEQRAVMRLLRPDPAWRVELGRLDHRERHERISRRVQERVLAALEARPDLLGAAAPAALEELRGLQGRAFGEALRRQLER